MYQNFHQTPVATVHVFSADHYDKRYNPKTWKDFIFKIFSHIWQVILFWRIIHFVRKKWKKWNMLPKSNWQTHLICIEAYIRLFKINVEYVYDMKIKSQNRKNYWRKKHPKILKKYIPCFITKSFDYQWLNYKHSKQLAWKLCGVIANKIWLVLLNGSFNNCVSKYNIFFKFRRKEIW